MFSADKILGYHSVSYVDVRASSRKGDVTEDSRERSADVLGTSF